MVASDVLYAACADGNVYAFDIESGLEKWEVKLDEEITTGIAVSDGILTVGTAGGFYVID